LEVVDDLWIIPIMAGSFSAKFDIIGKQCLQIVSYYCSRYLEDRMSVSS